MARGVELLEAMKISLASIDTKMGASLSDLNVPGRGMLPGLGAPSGALPSYGFPAGGFASFFQPQAQTASGGSPSAPINLPSFAQTPPSSASAATITIAGYSPQALDQLTKSLARAPKSGGSSGSLSASTDRTKGDQTFAQFLGSKAKNFLGGFASAEVAGKKVFPGAEKLGAVANATVFTLTTFGSALLKGVPQLQQFNQKMLETNLRFADFSPAMKMIELQQKLRDFQLGMERSGRLVNMADQQARAQHLMNQRIAPVQDFWTNTKSAISTFFSTAMVGFMKETGLTETFKNLNEWLYEQKTGGKKGDPATFGMWAQAVADQRGALLNEYGRPDNLKD